MGCDKRQGGILADLDISTHTSRVGCDLTAITTIRGTAISTHTSRVGCDHRNLHLVFLEKQFLLTHPVWDVTLFIVLALAVSKYFYSHIPCGM